MISSKPTYGPRCSPWSNFLIGRHLTNRVQSRDPWIHAETGVRAARIGPATGQSLAENLKQFLGIL